MSRLNSIMALATIFIMAVGIFWQVGKIQTLEEELRLANAKAESYQEENEALKNWLEDNAKTIIAMKKLCDENGITYDDVEIHIYEDRPSVVGPQPQKRSADRVSDESLEKSSPVADNDPDASNDDASHH